MPRSARRQNILIAIFLVMVLAFMTTFRMGVVRGDSMFPTYQDGQVVLVLRRTGLSAPLRRNDVVLLRKDRDVIIKRLYRLPGEEIDHTFPDVLAYTHRYRLDDYYEQQTVQTPQGPETHLFVPRGFLVVIGDNLRVSEDSRLFGPVPERDVLGVVVNAPPPPYTAADGLPQRGSGRNPPLPARGERYQKP
jgi:signal peptidase I